MKKLILFIFYFNIVCGYSQNFINDNFDSYNVGNVANDLTGGPGQGNWRVYIQNGGSILNSQFVTEVSKGKVLSIKSPATATTVGNNNMTFVWKEYPINAWANRTPENDILRVEYEFFTGVATTSDSRHSNYTFTSTRKIIAGFTFNPETKVLAGTGTNSSAVNLNDNNTDLVLADNQWIKVVYFINYETNMVTYKVPSLNISVSISVNLTSLIPVRTDFVTSGLPENTLASIVKYDNFTVDAIKEETTAHVNELVNKKINIYPNPVGEMLLIETNDLKSIQKAVINDVSGKRIKEVVFDNFKETMQLDVSDLAQGVYLMQFYTNEGIAIKKIIKK